MSSVGNEGKVSPYKAATLVTEWLRRDDEPGVVAPQMLYQYVGAGRIPATKDDDGHWQIEYTDLEEWYDEYLKRRHEAADRKQRREAAENEALREAS
jgi:hypothetical protein